MILTKSCRETIDLLMDYLEGRLSPEEEAALNRHFADCKPCLEFVNSYRKLPELFRHATKVAIPPQMNERLLRFLKSRDFEES